MSQLANIIRSINLNLDNVAGSPEAESAVVNTAYTIVEATEWDADDTIYILEQVLEHCKKHNIATGIRACTELIRQEKSML